MFWQDFHSISSTYCVLIFSVMMSVVAPVIVATSSMEYSIDEILHVCFETRPEFRLVVGAKAPIGHDLACWLSARWLVLFFIMCVRSSTEDLSASLWPVPEEVSPTLLPALSRGMWDPWPHHETGSSSLFPIFGLGWFMGGCQHGVRSRLCESFQKPSPWQVA